MTGADAVVNVAGEVEWLRPGGALRGLRHRHLRDLFADDPGRGTRMTVTGGDLYLDYSKHRATDETMDALMAVARRAGVEERRDAMFAGQPINTTEGRAVLHVALRMPRDTHLEVDGRDVVADVHEVLDRMGTVPRPSGPVRGPARPASALPPWSTSASAGPTSAGHGLRGPA